MLLNGQIMYQMVPPQTHKWMLVTGQTLIVLPVLLHLCNSLLHKTTKIFRVSIEQALLVPYIHILNVMKHHSKETKKAYSYILYHNIVVTLHTRSGNTHKQDTLGGFCCNGRYHRVHSTHAMPSAEAVVSMLSPLLSPRVLDNPIRFVAKPKNRETSRTIPHK